MKRLRRVALMTILTVIAIMITSAFTTKTYAGISSGYLTIKELRKSGYGYKALEKNIWKICESNSSGTTVNYDHTIYCLRGGKGFGSTIFGSGKAIPRPYTKHFDMKNPSSITGNYANAIPNPSMSNNTYKSLLWLLENVYVAPKTNPTSKEAETAAEYRELLLENAGLTGTFLTDDDIDAVQQLAVWHFTNNDEYKVENTSEGTFEFWINAIANQDSNYNPLSDYDNRNDKGLPDLKGRQRAEDCQILYDYLIETAENMGKPDSGYQIRAASQPYELEDLTITQNTEGDNYIIGPFQINKISETPSVLTGVFKNGSETITPTMQDAAGNPFSTLQETIGKKFYIVLSKDTTIQNITFTISGSYFDTKITYWSVDGAPEDDQPVVEVERTKETYTDTVTYTPSEPEKRFDLALRKFIVKIGDTELKNTDGTYTREPRISRATLQDLADGKIKTTVKTHPKNALEVKKGQKVIYTIRVYNEGEVAGIVRQITDYLPEGLKFVESQFNTDNGWSNPSGDKKTIVTDKLAGQTIPAFNKETLELKHLDVQIECEVTASSPAVGKTTLKNIAEITIHSDSTGKTTIKDDDSDPKNLTDDQKQNYHPEHPENGTGYEDDDDFEDLEILGKRFDLALRKFIIKIGDNELKDEDGKYTREPRISRATLQDLADGKIDTAVKTHPKNALEVKTGQRVIYVLRVYNEGEVAGIVKQITDYLPEGLKFVEDSQLNKNNGWSNPSGDGKTIVTDKLAGQTIPAFDKDTLELKHLDVQIECEVIATVQSKDNVLKNIAEITAHSDETGDTTIKDDDSDPNNVDRDNYGTTNQEDDDDFEQLILPGKYFDLALRKFITAVEDDKLVDADGKLLREPDVDVTPLANGQKTAIYNHPKKPINVDVGNVVTYTIRVYNEGEVDGYVHVITDHLPPYLEFINNEFNAGYGWKVSSNGRKVTTDITSTDTEYSAIRDTLYATRKEGTDKVLLEAFNKETKKLDYIDVQIQCRVKDTGLAEKITNIAEITKQTDSTGTEVKDRDSTPGNTTLPTDDILPEYKDEEIDRGDKYIPGQGNEDDNDFEKVIVQKFDLALRKFITGVNDKNITGRVPTFSINSEGKMTYTHPKTPVEVVNGDTVIYTLRIYNEGNTAGYADEVKDNIPEGLVYLPENELNKTYRWKMYKEDGTETTNPEEAKTIRTDYLSKAQEDVTKRDNLLDAFDKTKMTQPDHRDIRVAFKVTEPNTSDRILINIAEITKDSDEKGNPVDDIDSIPDDNVENQDDIDIEKVKVKYFDLALEKIITEYSIKLNGKTTTTKTGHKFGVQPEPVVKVETLKKTRKNATIKFKYQIKVTNEGEIAGYATEIKDYIPTGLKFVQKDNPKWKLSSDGKTVTTDQLKDKLLQPGQSAIVEITFQWINGENNLGLKQNWAEISKDKNDSNTPDIDSIPDDFDKKQDDIDDASVILSVVTGVGENYILIAGAVLTIIAGGLVLIKKFVI